MKKYLVLFLVILMSAILSGCLGAGKDTGVFRSSKEAVAAGEKLAQVFTNDDFSLKYPGEWEFLGAKGPISFMAVDKSAKGNFAPNINVITSFSNSDFIKGNIDEIKKQFTKTLSIQGAENVEFITVEKGKWQEKDAVYLEYKAKFPGGFDLQFIQLVRNDEKNFHAVTFAAKESQYKDVKPLFKNIIATIKFNVPKK